LKKDVTCVYAWNMVWAGFHVSELTHIHVYCNNLGLADIWSCTKAFCMDYS